MCREANQRERSGNKSPGGQPFKRYNSHLVTFHGIINSLIAKERAANSGGEFLAGAAPFKKQSRRGQAELHQP